MIDLRVVNIIALIASLFCMIMMFYLGNMNAFWGYLNASGWAAVYLFRKRVK